GLLCYTELLLVAFSPRPRSLSLQVLRHTLPAFRDKFAGSMAGLCKMLKFVLSERTKRVRRLRCRPTPKAVTYPARCRLAHTKTASSKTVRSNPMSLSKWRQVRHGLTSTSSHPLGQTSNITFCNHRLDPISHLAGEKPMRMGLRSPEASIWMWPAAN